MERIREIEMVELGVVEEESRREVREWGVMGRGVGGYKVLRECVRDGEASGKVRREALQSSEELKRLKESDEFEEKYKKNYKKKTQN